MEVLSHTNQPMVMDMDIDMDIDIDLGPEIDIPQVDPSVSHRPSSLLNS